MPDAHIEWRDTWIGSFCTALLLVVGKYVIGVYLGHASISSAYGAAGSMVVLMAWVYYAALILLFGAELTRAVATHRGTPVRPSRYARPVGYGWHEGFEPDATTPRPPVAERKPAVRSPRRTTAADSAPDEQPAARSAHPPESDSPRRTPSRE